MYKQYTRVHVHVCTFSTPTTGGELVPPEFLPLSITEPDVGVDECVLSVRWSEPVISCAGSVSRYVFSVTPPTSDCQSGADDCVFMTDQTQYSLTLNTSQTYNLTVRADDSCGKMGQPAKYDIDLTGTTSNVTWSVHICTIDAWAFKGTATGTYSMYRSLVSVQISRTTTYPVVSDC